MAEQGIVIVIRECEREKSSTVNVLDHHETCQCGNHMQQHHCASHSRWILIGAESSPLYPIISCLSVRRKILSGVVVGP
ncbi:hypothetical protein Mapa_001217 [Marchantia paleacea]|nr:hypothetical protein Mapa_001217 [Marchantia paleacea]